MIMTNDNDNNSDNDNDNNNIQRGSPTRYGGFQWGHYVGQREWQIFFSADFHCD